MTGDRLPEIKARLSRSTYVQGPSKDWTSQDAWPVEHQHMLADIDWLVAEVEWRRAETRLSRAVIQAVQADDQPRLHAALAAWTSYTKTGFGEADPG